MKNIKIEKVSDINFRYPYLEVFFKSNSSPFLEISISEAKELSFKFYQDNDEVVLNFEEYEYILMTAKTFLLNSIKNENDFLNLGYNLE